MTTWDRRDSPTTRTGGSHRREGLNHYSEKHQYIKTRPLGCQGKNAYRNFWFRWSMGWMIFHGLRSFPGKNKTRLPHCG